MPIIFYKRGGRMKVLVAIKRVIDPYVKVRLKADGSGVEDNKMSMNPFDEIAVEEAVRLKEKGIASEVIVVSIGNKAVTETLRTALALGCDKAIHYETEQSFEPLNIAKILTHAVETHGLNLVILGKQAIDGDNNQTGQMLAAKLSWPQLTFVSEVTVENKMLTCVREVDGGLETLKTSLPAVVTTDLRLNEPRYASLPNIMKAKRKPLEVVAVESLDLSLKQHVEVLELATPPKRQAGEMLADVDSLVSCLRDKEKLI